MHQNSAIPLGRITASVDRFGLLSATELEAWRELTDANLDYDSALLTPEFAGVVAGVRDDVRIIRAFDNGQLIAVLPVHLRPDGLARPLSAPFADYSGPLLARGAGLTVPDLLRIAQVSAFMAAAVPDPWNALFRKKAGNAANPAMVSHVIRCRDSSKENLMEQQRSKHAKRFKNFRRLRNQIEREAGTLRFSFGIPNQADLDTLLAYKSRQFKESGYVDLTKATQSRELLDAVAKSSHAFMTCISVDDTLVAGHFGVRVGASFHPWIAAFNPAFAHFSPGNVLLLFVLEQMQAMGLGTYDLANGHDHYKKYFANDQRQTWAVFETGTGLRAMRHRLSHESWRIVGANAPFSIAGRLQRRMDQIAVSEFGAFSRLRAFAYAVRARSTASADHRGDTSS